MSEDCDILIDCNLGTGNITFVGTGNTTFNATINCRNIEHPEADQQLNIENNAIVYVG